MNKKTKIIYCIMCILFINFSFLCMSCKDKTENTETKEAKIELAYTDIHLLENTSIDIKIIIEPSDIKDKEIEINMPESKCIESASIVEKDGELFLRIKSSLYMIEESEVLSGAYIKLKNYSNSDSKKSFGVTVHKEATFLTAPTEITYSSNLGTIEWKGVEGARFYEVSINGDLFTTSLTSIVLNEVYYGKVLDIKIKSLYDLDKQFPTFVDSDYSDIVKFMVLEKPKNLRHQSGVIYWDKIEGATSYSLIISTPSIFGGRQNEKIITVPATEFETQSYSSYNFSSSVTYTIRVKANGNNDSEYTLYGTQDSSPITVKKLYAPSYINFVQGLLSWEDITQNNGYSISVEKFNNEISDYEYFGSYISDKNYFTFDNFDGNIPSGQYKFSVKTLGNDIETLSGDDYQSIATTKLNKVQNLRIFDGGIYWDKENMASSYIIYLNSSPVSYISDEEFNSYFLGSSDIAGDYKIEVVACADGTNYYNSDKSETLTATKLDSTSLTLYENTLTWTKVNNATNYTLYLGNEKILLGDVKEYTLPNLLASGEYNVRIMATAEGKISSEYSRAINFTKLPTPKNLRVENGIVKWDKVESCTYYIVKYTYSDSTTKIKECVGNSYDFKGENAGIYSITVCANGQTGTVSSAYTPSINATKLVTPSAPWVDNGKLGYNEINSGILMAKIKNSSIECPAENFSAGNQTSFQVSLYAKGNSGEDNTNLISSGESEYLQVTVVDNLETPVIRNGFLIYSFPKGVTGIKLNFFKSGSLNSCYEIIKNKESESTESDFQGSIQMECYDNENLGAGLYNLKITPQFSSSSIESVKAGNIAYLYGGSDIKLSFCQLDRPQAIGSYYLNQDGIDAINNNESIEKFNEIINSKISNKYSGYLYWSEVKNATSYALKINGDDNLIKNVSLNSLLYTGDGLCLYRLDGDFTTDMSGYSFSVKAIGNESTYLSGTYSESTLVNKVKLTTVGEIKVKNGELTWNNIDGAFYEISYNGNLAYTYKNTFSLPDNCQSGTYKIMVRALPKNQYYYAGDYVSKSNVIKINSPIKFYIYGGQVQWSNVNNASRYLVEINGNKKEYDIQNVSFKLKDEINNNEVYTEKQGLFNISLKVIGTEDSDYIQNDYVYLSSSPIEISTTIMSAPSSIYVENGVLTWTSVIGATKYNLNFYHISENPENAKSIYINCDESSGNKSNYFTLGTGYQSGKYNFSISAIGDGSNYLNSEVSKEFTAEKLSNVENIAIEDGKLSFDLKAGAISYNAKISEYNSSESVIENFDDNIFGLGDKYKSGKYQIRFQAVGNTTSPEKPNELCYLSSDYSSVVSGYSEAGEIVNYVYKLKPSDSMYIANDAVNWDIVDNAIGYNLKVDQTIINVGETSSLQLKSGKINGKDYYFSSGSFNVNVQSLGGKYYLNSSFRQEEIVATKLDKVLDLGVENGVIAWSTVKDVPDNLALYINGECVANLRQSFFNNYSDEIGGVKGEKTYYVLGKDYLPGEYSISFVNAGGGDTGYLSSDSCDAINVTKISSPTNVSINSETNSIVWKIHEEQNTSIKYLINLYDYETNNLVQSFSTIDELSLVIRSLEVGKYYVRIGTVIKSSDKLLINSDISESLMVTMPATPIGLTISNGNISWKTIEGVSGYHIEFSFYEGTSNSLSGDEKQFRITINNENQNSISIKDFTFDETFVSLLGDGTHSQSTALGKYKVKINAFVSNSLQSDYTSYVGDRTKEGIKGYYFFKMFSDGKGTQNSPYKITNFEQLQNISYLPDLCYIQSTDIITNSLPFTPIGDINKPFTGEFNGDDYVIDNLNISVNNVEENLYVGMFGVVSGGTIKNLRIQREYINQGYYVGGICGYNNGGLIYDSSVSNGKIESKTKTTLTEPKPIYIGGICGYNSNNSIIDLCSYTGYVTTIDTITTYTSYSGGICGFNMGTISQCDTYSNNSSDKIVGIYAGGICGFNINTISYNDGQPIGSIYKCINKINVLAYSLKTSSEVHGYAGGICGMNISKSDDTTGLWVINNYSISFCGSIADVVCDSNGTNVEPYAGGLVGYAGNGMISSFCIGSTYGLIEGNIVTDIVSGTAKVNTGRIIGYKANNNYPITYCVYNILGNETLNQVGAESKNSRNLGLTVSTSCIPYTDSEFTLSSMVDILNKPLIDNNLDAVWTSNISDYPSPIKVKR